MKNALKLISYHLTKKFPNLIKKNKVIKNINGITYNLDLTELIDRYIYYYGYWEKDVTKVFEELVEPNMIVFDIGANIGTHTLTIAKILKNGQGRIFGIEPTNFAWKKLLTNINLNPFLDNIVIEKIGFSDEPGDIIINSSNICFRSSWNLDKNLKRKRGDKITLIKLDEYIKAKDIKRVDFMKLDTDGYEFKILKGGLETIYTSKPIIMMEIGSTLERLGDSIDDIKQVLKDLSYKIYTLKGEKLSFDKLHLFVEKECKEILCRPD